MFIWLKKFYDWVLHWAETPYAVYALMIIAFAESSFFPIPVDLLLIAMATSNPRRSLEYACLASLFSVLGGIGGYLIGNYFISMGINDFMIELGGEILVKGKNPNNELWTIGIEKPTDKIDI